MITYVYGDLLQSPARTLVNPVNTVGVMGSGLAREFKLCYPQMFDRYRDLCEDDSFAVGKLHLWRSTHKWVLNFPTKRHWRAGSRLADIEQGLQCFAATYAAMGITSVSFPLLGTGMGGLDWEREVRPLMETVLAPLPITVYIHLYDEDNPFNDPRRNIRSLRAWLEGYPQPVSFTRCWRDLVRHLNQERRLSTPDGSVTFTAGQDQRRRGRNLVLLVEGQPQPLFLSESMLGDLWAYVRSAGYGLPANFPGGLDAHAAVIVGLLSVLDTVRPVHLLDEYGYRQTGTHYIAPTAKHGPAHTLTLATPEGSRSAGD